MKTKKGSSLPIRRRFQLCRLLFFQKFVAFGRSNYKEADSECPNGLQPSWKVQKFQIHCANFEPSTRLLFVSIKVQRRARQLRSIKFVSRIPFFSTAT